MLFRLAPESDARLHDSPLKMKNEKTERDCLRELEWGSESKDSVGWCAES